MIGVLLSYLIKFMPLILAVAGWAKVYRARRHEPLHPFALTLLSFVTAFAAVEAGVHLFRRETSSPPALGVSRSSFFCLVFPVQPLVRRAQFSGISQGTEMAVLGSRSVFFLANGPWVFGRDVALGQAQ